MDGRPVSNKDAVEKGGCEILGELGVSGPQFRQPLASVDQPIDPRWDVHPRKRSGWHSTRGVASLGGNVQESVDSGYDVPDDLRPRLPELGDDVVPAPAPDCVRQGYQYGRGDGRPRWGTRYREDRDD